MAWLSWRERIRTLVSLLDAAETDATRGQTGPAHFDAIELNGLPPPVQRYFRTVLTEGQPLVTAAEVELSGSFNMSATGEQWKPFTSWQRNVTRGPGFLCEMAWYPTALLPSQGVQWTAVDADSAQATFTDGPYAVSLLFRFNAAGLIESAYATARGAMLGKEIVMLPWEGRWSDYQMRHGMLVPATGEVA